MNPEFDKYINRFETDSIKWTLYDKDALPLWVADMDYQSPEFILSAIRNRVDHGIFGYSKPQPSTQEAIQKWISQRVSFYCAILRIPLKGFFPRKELETLGEIFLLNNSIICSDEIHSDLVFPGHKHIPIASNSKEISSITITLISASKTFNIAGLKSSPAIITNSTLRIDFKNLLMQLWAGLILLEKPPRAQLI